MFYACYGFIKEKEKEEDRENPQAISPSHRQTFPIYKSHFLDTSENLFFKKTRLIRVAFLNIALLPSFLIFLII